MVCHEMKEPIKKWKESGTNVNHNNCAGCHYTADFNGWMEMNKSALNQLVEHFKRDPNEPLKPREEPLFLELDKEPDPDKLVEYFEKNRDVYKIPEKREADYYFIRNEDLKAKVDLTDAEIEEYYDDNTARFKEPEKITASRIYLPFEEQERDDVLDQAKDLLDKIQNGRDFGELAIGYSKDEKAQDAGDWGLYE